MRARKLSTDCFVSSDNAILMKRFGYNQWTKACWYIQNPRQPLFNLCGSCKNSEFPIDVAAAPMQKDAVSWIETFGIRLYLNECIDGDKSWWECRFIDNSDNTISSEEFNESTRDEWPNTALEKGITRALKSTVMQKSVLTAQEMDEIDSYLEMMRKNEVRAIVTTEPYNPLEHAQPDICCGVDSRSYNTLSGGNFDR